MINIIKGIKLIKNSKASAKKPMYCRQTSQHFFNEINVVPAVECGRYGKNSDVFDSWRVIKIK